jgi:hypothetical protein
MQHRSIDEDDGDGEDEAEDDDFQRSTIPSSMIDRSPGDSALIFAKILENVSKVAASQPLLLFVVAVEVIWGSPDRVALGHISTVFTDSCSG